MKIYIVFTILLQASRFDVAFGCDADNPCADSLHCCSEWGYCGTGSACKFLFVWCCSYDVCIRYVVCDVFVCMDRCFYLTLVYRHAMYLLSYRLWRWLSKRSVRRRWISRRRQSQLLWNILGRCQLKLRNILLRWGDMSQWNILLCLGHSLSLSSSTSTNNTIAYTLQRHHHHHRSWRWWLCIIMLQNCFQRSSVDVIQDGGVFTNKLWNRHPWYWHDWSGKYQTWAWRE